MTLARNIFIFGGRTPDATAPAQRGKAVAALLSIFAICAFDARQIGVEAAQAGQPALLKPTQPTAAPVSSWMQKLVAAQFCTVKSSTAKTADPPLKKEPIH